MPGVKWAKLPCQAEREMCLNLASYRSLQPPCGFLVFAWFCLWGQYSQVVQLALDVTSACLSFPRAGITVVQPRAGLLFLFRQSFLRLSCKHSAPFSSQCCGSLDPRRLLTGSHSGQRPVQISEQSWRRVCGSKRRAGKWVRKQAVFRLLWEGKFAWHEGQSLSSGTRCQQRDLTVGTTLSWGKSVSVSSTRFLFGRESRKQLN